METDGLAPLIDPRLVSIIEQMDSFSLAAVVTSSSSEDGENDVQIVEPIKRKQRNLWLLINFLVQRNMKSV